MLLKRGAKGNDVKNVQIGLRILCCYGGELDGVFGNGMEAGVLKFQEIYGLSRDGIVGNDTWNSLKEELASLQRALRKKGVYQGIADGYPKESTLEAVKRFQRKYYLKADGMVGEKTRAMLFSEESNHSFPIEQGARGDRVLAIQYALRILCCSPGSIDGIFGAGTELAVQKFQEKNKIPKTGKVDSLTWTKLSDSMKRIQKALNAHGQEVALEDGVASESLVTSIKNFQREKGLSVDGQVGPLTAAFLFAGDGQDGTTDAFPLSKGSRGSNVLYLQYGLRILCINPNGTDGVFGNGTESAVNRYKKKHGKPEDGKVDTATWEIMRSELREIQQGLRNRGYYNGPLDGIATETVYNGVLKFQKDFHMTADGMVGKNTKLVLLGKGDGAGTLSNILRPGSNGSLCRYLQQMLRVMSYQVDINGIYDEKTQLAVKAFQEKNGLGADAICGSKTWASLFASYLPLAREAIRREWERLSGEEANQSVYKLILAAKRELSLGFQEDHANNITPYGEWFGMNGASWCAMFVSYCAEEAGLTELFPKFSYTPSGVNWYKTQGRYHKLNDKNYVPKIGDLVFFYNSAKKRVAHVGIIISGDEKYIHTIEGNTLFDDVHERVYDRNHPTIDGFADNGGVPLYQLHKPEYTEREIQQRIQDVFVEMIDELNFQVLPPAERVENVDIPVFESPDLRVTFKVSRGMSWYGNTDSMLKVEMEYGRAFSFNADLNPYFSMTLGEGTAEKAAFDKILNKIAIGSDKSPVKFIFETEGNWFKLGYVSEYNLFQDEVHAYKVSYGYTFWVNSEHSRLAPALQKVQRKKEIAEAPIRARGEDWAMDPEVVEKARIITAGVAIATVVIAIFAMHPDPSIIDQFIDKLSKILFAPPSSVPNWQPT